jgi:hypothetical protein
MQQDETFPLAVIPPRVRRAILREFQGRWPTVQEVAQIPDRHWLATPDIGPSSLEIIHSVLHPQPRQSDAAQSQLSDAELLERLESIQEELRRIQRTLEARIGKALRRRLRSQDQVWAGPSDRFQG